MPSSCHGCFGVSFSCWPPGALLASVFKGNIGTGRPYCLCHESLLASSALLFSPLNGEIRSGGTEKGREERSRNYWRLLPKLFPLHQDVSWWVFSLLFLCCCYSGSATAGKWVSKCISLLFMLFKMWHLESFLKEASSFLLDSPLPERGRERQMQSPARVRSLLPSHMQIWALWWAVEDTSLNSF